MGQTNSKIGPIWQTAIFPSYVQLEVYEEKSAGTLVRNNSLSLQIPFESFIQGIVYAENGAAKGVDGIVF
jgi:hypothetical protein